ncbi:MAG: hypothetical protein J4452_00490, partial [Candidatus Aenigmarchaeota archaeon]|nr:hypothetical protein [Candidatus Aenigmarchaeota archaeon]
NRPFTSQLGQNTWAPAAGATLGFLELWVQSWPKIPLPAGNDCALDTGFQTIMYLDDVTISQLSSWSGGGSTPTTTTSTTSHSTTTTTLTTPTTTRTTATTTTTTSETLSSGWNLISSPRNTNFNNIIGNCNVLSGPWWYNPTTQNYVQTSNLETWKGYWISVSNNCQLG